MTAIDKYLRLEALGLWREREAAPPREVVVSFGRSTLVLSGLDDRPLGHWALAGIAAVGRDGDATVYAMTPGGEETLAIRDREMVAAIAAVARPALGAAARPARPRRRVPLGPLLGAAALVALGFALPRGIALGVARLMPPEQAAEYGDRMLIELIARQGPPCAGAAGARALARLAERLDPAAPTRARVMAIGVPVAALPGRTVVVDREALGAAASPAEVAGWVALGLGRDPRAALARDAGTLANLRYLVVGAFDERALARAAQGALEAPTPDESAAALALLGSAGIDAGDFRARLGAVGLLAETDSDAAARERAATPALDQPGWQSLRAICADPPQF
jgi:hypothetical protein